MRPTILTVLAICAGLLGAAGCSSQREHGAKAGDYALPTGRSAAPAWGTAHPRLAEDRGVPEAVVIDLLLNDTDHFPELYSAARDLAREPGVLTVDGAINLNLPESEGFRALRTDGDIMTNAEGYDPALSRVGEGHWMITIPLISEGAKRAIAEGGSIVILPDTSLQGLAFRW